MREDLVHRLLALDVDVPIANKTETDGCIPSDLGTGTTAEIEEERRLLYVAGRRAILWQA